MIVNDPANLAMKLPSDLKDFISKSNMTFRLEVEHIGKKKYLSVYNLDIKDPQLQRLLLISDTQGLNTCNPLYMHDKLVLGFGDICEQLAKYEKEVRNLISVLEG